MELRSLHIYRYTAGDHFSGTMEFNSERGEVKLKLRPGLSDKILAVVAEELVESAKEIATDLTAEVFNQTAALPAPKE